MNLDDAQVTRRLQAILQSDEFSTAAQELPAWMEYIKKWFAYIVTWLHELGDGPRLLLLLACVVMLAALVINAVSSIRRAQRRADSASALRASLPASETSATQLMQRAQTLAKAGQLRDAARALLQAVLVHMCAQRQQPWRASRADWEWVALLRPDARAVAFIRAAQHLAFGPVASLDGYHSCAREAQALLDLPAQTMPLQSAVQVREAGV